MILKCGDDLRHEQFAMQLICLVDSIFRENKLNLCLRPYEIVATSPDSGLVEFVSDGLSIDFIHSKMSTMFGRNCTLFDYFCKQFGMPNKTSRFKKAQTNFADSLAAYSLVCYILQIKDRHNANIIIDREGHLIHIDFGYMLKASPGQGLEFESAPFKLIPSFEQILMAYDGNGLRRFKDSMVKGLQSLNKNAAKIVLLV